MKKVFRVRLGELLDGRTVAEFARIVGIPQQTMDRYLKGERTPNGDNVYEICSKLNVSADWLLGLTNFRGVDPPAAVAEPKMYELPSGCVGCAARDAVIADQAAAIRDLSSAVGGQKKTTVSREPSCSRSATPV